MKTLQTMLITATLIGLSVATGTAQEQGAKMHGVSDSAPLKVVLTSSKQRVKQTEDFVLEAKILNVSGDPVSMFSDLLWGYAGGFTLHISDESGRPVEPEQHDDDMVVPSVLGNPEYYVVLLPDHFLGVLRKDSAKNLFPKPGLYSVFVEYQSPVPERYAKTPHFWGRGKGTIRSAPIRIEVVRE